MERFTLDKLPKPVLATIDVQKAFILSRLINACEQLQVFRVLHGKRMTADAIGKELHVHQRYLPVFLHALVSLGLLRHTDGKYGNTRCADKYFVNERSIHWTRRFSAECIDDYALLTVLERALMSGKSCETVKGLKKPSYTESMQRNRRQAEDFTQMLFYLHQGEAKALASHLDLSGHKKLLDVGGGSGVMSIALAKSNPHLCACVLDIPAVCAIAARNIRQAGLSNRIWTLPGDIRKPLPAGHDVIMFCDIGTVPKELLQHAYRALPPKGLVTFVDRYLSDDGLKPLDRLLEYFVGSSFGLATHTDMVESLKSSGFRQARATNFYREVWCVRGTKPAA